MTRKSFQVVLSHSNAASDGGTADAVSETGISMAIRENLGGLFGIQGAAREFRVAMDAGPEIGFSVETDGQEYTQLQR